MIIHAYHGTSYKIEFFDVSHLKAGQGNSVGPGVYFTKNLEEAKQYAQLSSQKTGKPERVYAAELEINNPLMASKGQKFFSSMGEFLAFLKRYFPNWFESDGSLMRIKWDYVKEKFSTYQGQWNMIQFASEESGEHICEVFLSLGFDSIVDGMDIVIPDPSSILSFEEIIGPDAEQPDSATESAYEALIDRYLLDSRHGEDYRTMPGNRYKRRMRIKQNGGARVWYDIDINKFFKQDKFLFHIPVIGETNDYICELEVERWLPLLRQDIQKEGFSVMTFKKSLGKALRVCNIKSHCSCPDFAYTQAYWFTMKGDNSGRPEARPAKITNPKDRKGRGCKHLNFVMSLKIWTERVARILFNYCFNLYKQNKILFNAVVTKVLGVTDEMVENRPIRQRKKPEPTPQPEPEKQEQPQEETPEEMQLEETEETEEEEKPAGEAYYGGYYTDATEYDEEQQLMIQSALDFTPDIESYITPQNSPDQIWEIARSIQSHLPDSVIEILKNPDISSAEHRVIRDAYLKGVDLTKFIGFDPDVLKQLYLASKSGIDPQRLAIKGMNARQIEQIRQAMINGEPYEKLLNPKLNYNDMKRLRLSWRK